MIFLMYGGIFVKLFVDKIIAEIDNLVLELGFKRPTIKSQ